MSFTGKDYKSRVKGAGFNLSQWAKHVGVTRSTIMRHCSGKIDPIPVKFWIALDTLDGKGFPR